MFDIISTDNTEIPTLVEAAAKARLDGRVMEVTMNSKILQLGKTLVQHDMNRMLQVFMIHKHYPVAKDEVVVKRQTAHNKWFIGPQKLADFNKEVDLVPYVWYYNKADNNWTALEFIHADSKHMNPESIARYRFVAKCFQDNNLLRKKLANQLLTLGLDSTFGIIVDLKYVEGIPEGEDLETVEISRPSKRETHLSILPKSECIEIEKLDGNVMTCWSFDHAQAVKNAHQICREIIDVVTKETHVVCREIIDQKQIRTDQMVDHARLQAHGYCGEIVDKQDTHYVCRETTTKQAHGICREIIDQQAHGVCREIVDSGVAVTQAHGICREIVDPSVKQAHGICREIVEKADHVYCYEQKQICQNPSVDQVRQPSIVAQQMHGYCGEIVDGDNVQQVPTHVICHDGHFICRDDPPAKQ